MRRQGSRGRDLRNLEEQLASRLLRGFGSPNVGVADVKEKIDPFPDGKRSSSRKAATASCRLANHASEDVGTTVSGQQSSGRVNESRRARDRLAEPADIQQASGSHQGDLARERRAREKMIEDDARRVSVTDAQPAMMSDSSSSLGDGGSSANLECEETGGMSTLKKAARERDATTGREAQRRLASSAKGNAGSCDDQAPRPIRAYPLVGKAGGGMCWLRNGVLEPIGGRLSREAIRATRARMRKELAEEASKEADRLAILLKISEDEEEERSILQDPKFSSKESVSAAAETPDVKRLFDERFNIRKEQEEGGAGGGECVMSCAI
ncbi:hypothetical protein CBR_g23905 [Chara braunii]|uniref:Uncharacterized protein n=1 Tax=Chara braunii TaxID=69332 RepID=A0A388L575_CHABU|nr:hypothetical protein CBR_g23905 [Chara braunii]|eukprot:GBG77456.1 hypothetical protein CBR_g23905 [Chara braunii]